METLMEDQRPTTTKDVGNFEIGHARFPIESASVGCVRQFLKALLGAWSIPDTADAELLASEIVTNVVRHVGGRPLTTMHIRVLRVGERVRVEVQDPSSEPPKPRQAGELDESGHGLLLVEMLAADWDFTLTPSAGKVVWFEVFT
jgi:anti-sigma regulatory factor (Ser/Thr protein kinase)